MNRNFAKIDESNKIIYAPDTVTVNGVRHWHPFAEHYAAADDGPWHPLDNSKPEKVGVYFISTEYGDEYVWLDGRKVIARRYDDRPIVAPPRRIRHFSKLSLYVVLTKLGITDEAFMAWLATKQVEVEGVTIRCDLAFNKAQDLTDNHPAFESIVKDAQTKFGISNEQLAEILAAIEYNPMEV